MKTIEEIAAILKKEHRQYLEASPESETLADREYFTDEFFVDSAIGVMQHYDEYREALENYNSQQQLDPNDPISRVDIMFIDPAVVWSRTPGRFHLIINYKNNTFDPVTIDALHAYPVLEGHLTKAAIEAAFRSKNSPTATPCEVYDEPANVIIPNKVNEQPYKCHGHGSADVHFQKYPLLEDSFIELIRKKSGLFIQHDFYLVCITNPRTQQIQLNINYPKNISHFPRFVKTFIESLIQNDPTFSVSLRDNKPLYPMHPLFVEGYNRQGINYQSALIFNADKLRALVGGLQAMEPNPPNEDVKSALLQSREMVSGIPSTLFNPPNIISGPQAGLSSKRTMGKLG